MLPEGTVTLLFTDIEGSTRRWEQHPAAMPAALSQHDAIIRTAVVAQGGDIFKAVGDGFCATFAEAPAALAAMLMIQHELAAVTWGETGPLLVRTALHTGRPTQLGNDYFGPDLNRLARLLSAGHGGQMLLSQAAFDRVAATLPPDCTVRDMGERRLRDLREAEHIYQLVAADLPDSFLPLRTIDATPNNLPAALTSFIGRDREMGEGKRLLGHTRLLTLTGPGGIGKTRLSIELAGDLLDSYPGGVWLVELAQISEPNQVAPTIAAALGLAEEPGTPTTLTLRKHLHDRRVLLILDNCEQVVVGAAQMAADLLRTCPDLTIIASSRETLSISGETVWRLPGLALPDSNQSAPADPAQYEAVQLFAARAATASPTFALTAQNADIVLQICQRLDGISLAIELAAARVRLLSVEQIAARLDDRFRLLTGGSRTALPRQQTLKALVDWSYDLLDDEERATLRRLAVFLGGCTLEAATMIADFRLQIADFGRDEGEAISKLRTEEVLEQLVNKSLLIADTAAAEPRYMMLETIRHYNLDRLVEAGEAAAARDRQLAYFVALTTAARPHLRGPQQVAWLNRLEQEHDNLRAAFAWATDTGNTAAAGQLFTSLAPFFIMHSHYSQAHDWAEAVLALPNVAAQPNYPRILENAGVLDRLFGQRERATLRLQAALELAQNQDKHHIEAYILYNLNDSLERYDDPATEANLHRAIALFGEAGDDFGMAIALDSLAHTARRRNDFDTARLRFEVSLELHRKIGNLNGIATSLWMLGFLAQSSGEYATARETFAESITLYRTLGSRNRVANLLLYAAEVERDMMDYAAAATLYEEARQIATAVNERPTLAYALGALAELARVAGDRDTARQLANQSLTLARQTESAIRLATSTIFRSNVARDDGDFAYARALLREGVEQGDLGEGTYHISLLHALALLATAEGKYRKAAVIFAAADAYAATNHFHLSHRLITEAYVALATISENLTADELIAAQAKGESLSSAEAFALGLDLSW